MKKCMNRSWLVFGAAVLSIMLMLIVLPMEKVQAKSEDKTISEGVYMGQIDLSGMTAEEARNTVDSFVNDLKQRVVTFGAVGEHYVAITTGDLNLSWTNPEAIEEAVGLGKEGNIVQRYKALQDLKHGKKVYDLSLDVDKDIIESIMLEQCAEYDIPAVNATLKRENGVFSVVEGQT